MVGKEVISSWRRVASTHDLQDLLSQGPVPYAALPPDCQCVQGPRGKTPGQGPQAASTSFHVRHPWQARALGAALLLGGISGMMATCAVAVLKLMPTVTNSWGRAVQDDWYYCIVIPGLLPATLTAVLLNWFFLKLFKHNS